MLFYFLFYKYNNKNKIINLINLDKAYPNNLILISIILFYFSKYKYKSNLINLINLDKIIKNIF